jgi:CYTH domain-containing protein
VQVPKYAKLEIERRVLVNPARAPDLTGLPFRRIEDRYLDGTRLRLRCVTDSVTGARELKFCKKYEGAELPAGPVVNIYLTEPEYAALATIPAAVIRKRRYRVGDRPFGLDVFEGALEGLVLCEAEAESLQAARALVFPDWTDREVTADPFFTGGALARIEASTLRQRLAAAFGAI